MPFRNHKKRYPLENLGFKPSTETTIIAAFVGVLAGFGALFFKHIIGLLQKLFWHTADMSPESLLLIPLHIRILIPAIGGLIVGPMIYFWAREAKGHGVPEVMLAVIEKNSVIRPVVVFVKTFASAISIASGGSVGREGPIVQIGAAIASTTGQLFKLRPAQMKTILGCGVAAGIGATFNAPIAGTIFALELIVSDFGLTSFTPIIVAAVTSTSITRHFEGNTLAFYLPQFEMVTIWELFIYLFLGLIAGLVGYLFNKILYGSEDVFTKLKFPSWLKASLGGLIIGLIAIKFPHIMGVGYETIGGLFNGEFTLWLIISLIFIKILATSITIGSGGSGGIFAPSLFIGAMLGGAFGTVVNMILPEVTGSVGAYALVGMAAVNGACTLAPLSSIIILIELTDNYGIILPLMLTVVISTFVSRRISADSIYTKKLARKGIQVHQGEDVNILKSVGVKDILRHDESVISGNASFEELINLALNKHRNVIFIVDSENKYTGLISLQQLKHALSKTDSNTDKKSIGELAEYSPPVSISESLDTVLNAFGESGFDRLPVVDEINMLTGSVVISDVIAQYNREVINRNVAIELGAVIHSDTKFEKLKLGEDVIVTEISVPKWMDGKTIEEIALRKNKGVSIFLVNEVRKGEDTRMITPNSKYVLHFGDILLVSGKEKDINGIM
ncbi:chloride channel protein [Candidatus Latescibacterota bacterium]